MFWRSCEEFASWNEKLLLLFGLRSQSSTFAVGSSLPQLHALCKMGDTILDFFSSRVPRLSRPSPWTPLVLEPQFDWLNVHDGLEEFPPIHLPDTDSSHNVDMQSDPPQWPLLSQASPPLCGLPSISPVVPPDSNATPMLAAAKTMRQEKQDTPSKALHSPGKSPVGKNKMWRSSRKHAEETGAKLRGKKDSAKVHVEQVAREQHRRECMNSKISILESLLPPSAKRDKTSVVHQSIEYVRELLHKKESLQRRLGALKRRLSSEPVAAGADTNQAMDVSPDKLQLTTAAETGLLSCARYGSESDSGSLTTKVPYVLEGKLFAIHLQVQLDNPAQSLVMNVEKRSFRSNYLSNILKALEQLQLDLTRCSVTRSVGCESIICVIFAKPKLGNWNAALWTIAAATLDSALEFS